MISGLGMFIVVCLLGYLVTGKCENEDIKIITFTSLLLNFIFFFFEWLTKI